MLRYIFIAVLMFLSVNAAGSIFEVLEESDFGLTVRFTLPPYELEVVEIDGIAHHSIKCAGAFSFSETPKPTLPFFSETIGIPIDGNFEISILNKDQKAIPVLPLIRIEESFFKSPVSNYKDKTANNAALYPELLIKKGETAYLGDRHFAGFSIFPFQYMNKQKKLLVTTDITFRIDLTGNISQSRNILSSSNHIDAVGDHFFLNNRTSQYWRKEREQTSNYIASNREGDFVNEIKFVVDEDGIYQVTYEQLIDALTDPDYPIQFELEFDWDMIDPRFLELSDKEGPVPIYVYGEGDGSFDAGDYIEFFGVRHTGKDGYHDAYTSENVYYLRLLEEPGARMAVESGGLVNFGQTPIEVPVSYQQTVHFEKQNTIEHLGAQFEFVDPNFYREDIWFWSKINGPGIEIIPFELEYPQESNIRRYTADVCLFSTTYNDDNQTAYEQINHFAQVNINTDLIDQKEWYGQSEVIFSNSTNPITNSKLNHGLNNLFISLPGLPNIEYQQVMLDYFDVTYWRYYKTDNDILRFTKPQNEPLGLFQFELENFSTGDIFIYKIGSSIIENFQIEAFFETGKPPYTITFQDEVISESTEYYAVSAAKKKSPKFILPNHPSSLKSITNSAEYIIITIQNFTHLDATQQFKQLWEDQGYQVKIVAVEDIFDEFNHGIRSADAIKDFLQYAYNNWSYPHLSHVVLLGDGITDERDNSSNRKYNLIPFRNIWVEKRGAIASDNWLACIVGDDPISDVSISRINVWEASQIENIFNKSAHYIQNPNYQDTWHSRVVLAAGGNPGEGSFFAEQSERIKAKWIPEDYFSTRIYCNVSGLPPDYFGNTTKLLSSINDGSLYVQFMGHGGGYVWADYNLLNKADVSSMNNQNYPLFSSLSCFGSAFNYPQSSCIGEELILTPNKGAIAHVGFTGYGYKNADEIFGMYLNEAIFNLNIKTIGEIIEFTKAKFYSTSYPGNSPVGIALTHGCALLGDPMINLFPALENREVSLEKYNLAAGDTLKISSLVGNDVTHGKFIIFDENDIQLPLTEYFPFMRPAVGGELNVEDYVVPASANDIYSRKVKLFGYGPNKEVTGITHFSVGQSAVANIQVIPQQPTQDDQIMIKADFFDEDGIAEVLYENVILNTTIEMINSDGNTWELSEHLPASLPGTSINYRFRILDSNGESTITASRNIIVIGPDLLMDSVEFVEYQNLPAIKALIKNIGSQEAGPCYIKIYDPNLSSVIIAEKQIEPLPVMQSRIEYLTLPEINENLRFRVVVNQDEESFNEISYINNTKDTPSINMNSFTAGLSAVNVQSNDGNLWCEFPADLLPEDVVFYINEHPYKAPLNQADNATIMLADSTISTSYEIDTYSPDLLADSLGFFPGGKKVSLKLSYHPTDSLTTAQAQQGNLFLYRWEEDFRKWILMGGSINLTDKYVAYNINRTGIYTILQNNDTVLPFVEANIEAQEFTQGASSQGQEFTYGGYVSKNGIISFILNDANGIDVFNRKINLYLSDGSTPVEISENEYSITLAPGNLTHIPVKYQLNNFSGGTYYLTLDCYDVNGNAQSIGIEFDVNRTFDVLNFANYPNPVKLKTVNPVNEGRTRFTYVLTDDADKVTLKIYTVSGRLVKSFHDLPTSVGYHEYPRTIHGWDCRDKNGFFLSNGVYFYRIIAKKSGKTIEKTEKMAIIR